MYYPVAHPAANALHPLQFLGAPVAVHLSNGEVVQGEVFCYDMNGSKTVVLREQKDVPDRAAVGAFAPSASFRIIQVQHVRSVTGLGPPPPVIDFWLPPCNPKVLEERERAACAALEATRHTIGIGVTREAQAIFDFIHKTHPDCCWTKDWKISVMGVTVNPPYGAEDCEGSGRALDRIKEVILRYRQRCESDKQKGPPAANILQQPQLINQQMPLASFSTLDANGNFIEQLPGPALTANYQHGGVVPIGFASPPAQMGNQSRQHSGNESRLPPQRGPSGAQPVVMPTWTDHSGPVFASSFSQGQATASSEGPQSAVLPTPVIGSRTGVNPVPSADTSDNTAATRQNDANVQGDSSGAPLNSETKSPLVHEQAQPSQLSAAAAAAETPVSSGPSSLRPFPSGNFNSFPRADSSAPAELPAATPEAVGTGWQTHARHSNKGSKSHQRRGGNRNRRDG